MLDGTINDIGYPVGKNSLNEELELDVNWEWFYRQLESGKYQIVKDTFIDDAWETRYYLAAEFVIE